MGKSLSPHKFSPHPAASPLPSPTRGEGFKKRLPLPLWERVGVRGEYSQRGSAMIYIFIGIALFGMLMFIMSRNNDQNSSSLTDQQAKILAAELVDYSRTIEASVQKLLAKGCSETQISFDFVAPPSTCPPSGSYACVTWSYNNTNSPSDKSCHIFYSNGGKAKYLTPKTTWYGNASGNLTGFQWRLSGAVRVFQLGSGNTELILNIGGINDKICMAINSSLGIPNNNDAPPSEPFVTANFTGTFGSNPGPVATDGWPHQIGDDNTNFRGKSSGCAKSYGGSSNVFYRVLIAR